MIERSWLRLTIVYDNEVHRKTDTLFPGNSMTVAELEPLIIRSGGSSSNHYTTLPPKKKECPSNFRGVVWRSG